MLSLLVDIWIVSSFKLVDYVRNIFTHVFRLQKCLHFWQAYIYKLNC
jgi:hypothetical protein